MKDLKKLNVIFLLDRDLGLFVGSCYESIVCIVKVFSILGLVSLVFSLLLIIISGQKEDYACQ